MVTEHHQVEVMEQMLIRRLQRHLVEQLQLREQRHQVGMLERVLMRQQQRYLVEQLVVLVVQVVMVVQVMEQAAVIQQVMTWQYNRGQNSLFLMRPFPLFRFRYCRSSLYI